MGNAAVGNAVVGNAVVGNAVVAGRRQWLASWAHSSEIGSDDFEQLLSGLGVERLRMLLGIDQMSAHVFLDYLRH